MTLLDQIRKHIVEEGDCWNWTGAMQTSRSVPTMHYQGKVGAVRRFILLERGVDLSKRLASYTCGNPFCVNPAHVAPSTRRAVQKRTSNELNYQSSLLHRKKISDSARTRAKLTPELASQVRDAEGSQSAIAARFGVSQAVVSSIKRGRTWRNYSSPFAGLGL